MNSDPAKIFQEALALPADERAALVDSLLDSLDTEIDEDAEAQWIQEIERRISQLESGTIRPIPWTVARSRIMKALKSGR